ncbi:MAG: SMI1/KNR4 family protein, partial [Chloroflexi bacterium]
MATLSMVDEWIAANASAGSPGATDEELDAAAADLDIRLPSDYRAMMRRVNGGETEFGDSWIRLWRAGDLAEHNGGYQVREFAPGFTYFGSNGGGEAYA